MKVWVDHMPKSKLLIFAAALLTFDAGLAKDANADLYACIMEEKIAMDASQNYKMFRVVLGRFIVKMNFDKPSVESEKISLMPFNTACIKSGSGEEFTCTTGWGKSFTYNKSNSRFVMSYNATDGDDPSVAIGTCERF